MPRTPQTSGDDVVLRVENLRKLYRRTTAGHHLRTLKSVLVERNLVTGLRDDEAITAVHDVSFTVRRGEAVGLIGSNGSGKSTLLKLAAGILRPTSGEIVVDGRVAALIELGAGFHPEISGRENIFINGAVLGLSRREVEERYDDIVAFSGLGDFIDEPVKNYSSGMYVRLGFAVAVHTDPDILMVDEVLAVGDEAFAHRCLRRIDEFLASGRTLVMVSHSLSMVEDVCDRVIWLEKGHLRRDGHPRQVIDAYREAVADAESEEHREELAARQAAETEEQEASEDDSEQEVLRWGSRAALIESVRPMVDGEETYHLHSGDDVTFEIEVLAQQDLEDFVFGVGISTPRGIDVWGNNTDLDEYEPGLLRAGRTIVHLDCPRLRLAPGEYLFDFAVHDRDGAPYDYRRRLLTLTVTSSSRGVGLYFPLHRWRTDDQQVVWAQQPTAESAPEFHDRSVSSDSFSGATISDDD